MSKAPSDWQHGVQAAAVWLRENGFRDVAATMEAKLVPMDAEGTEVRAVRQIVQWVREQGFGQTGETRVACARIAVGIEKYDWRLK